MLRRTAISKNSGCVRAINSGAKAYASCKLYGARIYEVPRSRRVGTEVAKRGRL